MILKKISELRKDELVKYSFVLLIFTNIYNLLNYVFHFSMARFLDPSDYGILATLMSIIYIFSIPSEAIQTIISKYAGILNINKEYGKIKDLFLRSLKRLLGVSFFIFIVFIILSIFLSELLKIDFLLIALTGLFIFYVLIIPVFRGILQGRKKFTILGISLVAESLAKLFFGIILVLIGWKVYGSISGLLIGGLISVLYAVILLRDVIKVKRERTSTREVYSYSLPVFIALLPIILISSLDIILAKRFFEPDIAGKYAVASMLGKMIFFGSSSIGKTMFSLSTENHETGKSSSENLKKSIKMTVLISLFFLFLFLFFPKFIISTLFDPKYIEISNILFIVGLTFTFISLSYIFVLYGLSINRTKKSFFLLIFVGLYILVLSIFNSNLMEFSIASLLISFLIMIFSLILARGKIFSRNFS